MATERPKSFFMKFNENLKKEREKREIKKNIYQGYAEMVSYGMDSPAYQALLLLQQERTKRFLSLNGKEVPSYPRPEIAPPAPPEVVPEPVIPPTPLFETLAAEVTRPPVVVHEEKRFNWENLTSRISDTSKGLKERFIQFKEQHQGKVRSAFDSLGGFVNRFKERFKKKDIEYKPFEPVGYQPREQAQAAVLEFNARPSVHKLHVLGRLSA